MYSKSILNQMKSIWIMIKKVIRVCDVCGVEHSYESEPVSVIPDWMIPGWAMKKEYYTFISFSERNGTDHWNTNLGECCPECTENIRNAFHQKVALLRLRKGKQNEDERITDEKL